MIEKRDEVEARDESRHLASHQAVRSGCEVAVRISLENGVDIIPKYSGNRTTALHWAVHNRDEGILKLLLEYEGHINAKDKNGETALHWAA